MSILEIIKEPNLLLRQKSLEVTVINDELKNFMNSMLDTMYDANGSIGIAAIQVGNPIRALIVDIPKKETNEEGEVLITRKPFFIINPLIKHLSEEKVILSEGCLSVREGDGISFIRGDVERPLNITISYINLDNEQQELIINGNNSDYDLWFARCLQHEIDHLNGILFIDKLIKPIGTSIDNIEVVGDMHVG